MCLLAEPYLLKDKQGQLVLCIINEMIKCFKNITECEYNHSKLSKWLCTSPYHNNLYNFETAGFL